MVNAVASPGEASEAQAAVQQAGQYVLAMSIELERRKITGGAADISSFSEEVKKRSLELSAYFTVPEMEHRKSGDSLTHSRLAALGVQLHLNTHHLCHSLCLIPSRAVH